VDPRENDRSWCQEDTIGTTSQDILQVAHLRRIPSQQELIEKQVTASGQSSQQFKVISSFMSFCERIILSLLIIVSGVT
jgi:hypothetical protein